MKNLRSILMTGIAMLLMASLYSCEVENASDVNQEKIYTIYEQFYDANSDKTTVVAQFKFGGPTGTILKLNTTDFVTFNGEELPYNAFYAGYVTEFAGEIDAGTFSYTNAEGQTFTNQVPTVSSIAFPDDFDTITKSKAEELMWDGSALANDESVGLFIGSWKWGDDALYLQTSEGASKLVLGKIQKKNLPVGPSTCILDRTKQLEAEDATSEGGVIRNKYRAVSKEVQIVE